VAEGIERARDDDVRRIDRVHGVGDALTMSRYLPALTGLMLG
jgi:hypothetical protein